MKKLFYLTPIAVLFGLVDLNIAHAQFGTTVNDVLVVVFDILDMLVPIIIGLAVLYFLWGVANFILAKEEDSKTSAKNTIIKGLIGIFVMVALWGIIALLSNTIGVGPGAVTPPGPQLPR